MVSLGKVTAPKPVNLPSQKCALVLRYFTFCSLENCHGVPLKSVTKLFDLQLASLPAILLV